MSLIRPIVLNSVISNLDSQENWDLFRQIVRLKMEGYGVEYPPGTMPIDVVEFYGAHLLWVRDGKQGPEVLSALRAVSYQDCASHRHTFSGLALVEQADEPRHQEAVRQLIEETLSKGQCLGYLSGWTVHPAVRKDPELRRQIKDSFVGLYCHFRKSLGIERTVIGGTPRFKTDEMFWPLGYQSLALGGEVLPLIRVRHLFGEQVRVMVGPELNAHAEAEMKRTSEIWSALEWRGPQAAGLNSQTGVAA